MPALPQVRRLKPHRPCIGHWGCSCGHSVQRVWQRWRITVPGEGGGHGIIGQRAFIRKLEALHEQTLAKHTGMKTASQEQAAHEQWDDQQALKPKRRKQQGPLRPCPSCRWEAT